jgi:demethoxyubiquinone hydroxylase (CLK1/Coq7/Cat5 family)
MPKTDKRTIETLQALNQLLKGELSAVDTYSTALTVVSDDEDKRQDLRDCQASHENRVLRLCAEIMERGGEPAQASGLWGSFASLIERGASAVGPRMVIGALEAGESHGLKEYQEVLPKLDMPARSVVCADLYPQQVRTHSIVATLKTTMAAPVIG